MIDLHKILLMMNLHYTFHDRLALNTFDDELALNTFDYEHEFAI